MWPFASRRIEKRGDATVAVVDRIEATAAAGGTLADEYGLAVSEACIALWTRAMASASVEPRDGALAAVDPACMALVGRAIARRGEIVFAIEVDGAAVRLVPAAAHDVYGDADPETWRYRVDLAGPSGTRTAEVPGAAVLHPRINADAAAPWRGRSPLWRAASTARLAAQIERAMLADASLPTGVAFGIASLSSDQTGKIAGYLKQGGFSVLANGGFTGEAAGKTEYRPAPSPTLESLRTATGREIAAAYGVPPNLFAVQGDGAGAREGWRRFWLGTIAPIGRVIEAELRAKLDSTASVSFAALRASDEDGRSRAVARRAQAFATLTAAGVEHGEALRMAGLDGRA